MQPTIAASCTHAGPVQRIGETNKAYLDTWKRREEPAGPAGEEKGTDQGTMAEELGAL